MGLCTPTKATNPVLNNEVNAEPVSDRGPNCSPLRRDVRLVGLCE